jgi:hypothetical protein
VVSSTPQAYFTSGKDTIPIVQEAGWATGLVWTSGKSHPTGIRSLDRPAMTEYHGIKIIYLMLILFNNSHIFRPTFLRKRVTGFFLGVNATGAYD